MRQHEEKRKKSTQHIHMHTRQENNFGLPFSINHTIVIPLATYRPFHAVSPTFGLRIVQKCFISFASCVSNMSKAAWLVFLLLSCAHPIELKFKNENSPNLSNQPTKQKCQFAMYFSLAFFSIRFERISDTDYVSFVKSHETNERD